MAEPLSFAASIVAISQLAGIVALKGHRYLKAVKDCSEDVRRLIVETDVLCGILTRLVVLLRGTTSKLDNNVKEAAEIDSSSETDDDEDEASDPLLGAPDFIHECRKTLEEIQGILHRFGQSSAQSTQSSQSTGKRSRYSLSALRSLQSKDLKWPLSKSETLQLVQRLERHKSTCAMALAGDGLHGIHSVLEQTKISNKHLADLRAKQERVLELQLNEVEKTALAWLSPVNPTLKHRAFKRDRHPGTGTWLFDLPEMINWLDSPNDALWIYGIPGSGKTTLSTLVVDEVLARVRSECIATAYFYVRHDDKDSHELAHVIGSLISQLACQNTEALADLVDLHTQYARWRSFATIPDDQDLIEKLQIISSHFKETYIMIDGLDECRFLFDACRERLIDAMAGLSDNEGKSIRTLIFSRDAPDIRIRFRRKNFHAVSIAACSADLRLFTNSWLAKLNIRSERLKIDVLETLVNEANGMFMWVRAQVDYLQRLPNDREKRSALKELPPDLPQTYIRIFESIHASFPAKTRRYIQRLLKWLVYRERGTNTLIYSSYMIPSDLSSDSLRQIISVEKDYDWPTGEDLPTVDQLHHWLGCLIRVTEPRSGSCIELSHFTVKEFLSMSRDKVSNPDVQQYLVDCSDWTCLADDCMTYLTHSHFRDMEPPSLDEIETFLLNHPFYRYAAVAIFEHLSSYNVDIKPNSAIQRFFSIPPSKEFIFWLKVSNLLDGSRIELDMNAEIQKHPLTPLHFAAIAGLKNQMKQILANNITPTQATQFDVAPLHVTIAMSNETGFFFRAGYLEVPVDLYYNDFSNDKRMLQRYQRSLEITTLLVDSGANIDQRLVVKQVGFSDRHLMVTPLVLSLLCKNLRVANFLLDVGAKWDVIAKNNLGEAIDVCSVKNLLEIAPAWESVVECVAESEGHTGMKDTLDHWRHRRDEHDASHRPAHCSISTNIDPQKAFINAFTNEKWQKVRELLASHSNIDLNCFNRDGYSAVSCAATADKDTLRCILEHGGDPNLLTKDSCSALGRAAFNGRMENMELLLKFGGDIEHIDPNGFTSLFYAIMNGSLEALQLLISSGADVHAMLDDGSSALLVAIGQSNVPAFSALLLAGVDPNMPNNLGCSPLYEACNRGLHEVVGILLALPSVLANSLDAETMYLLNPLYVAASQGFDRIVKMLLNHGAKVDREGPRGLGSPLLEACAANHSAIVRLLLARGASLDVVGSRFGSAAGTARAFRREAILNILEAHEINPLPEEEDEWTDVDSSHSSGEEENEAMHGEISESLAT